MLLFFWLDGYVQFYLNVLSSEGRSKACFDYAESRKTTDEIERFK